MSLTFNPAHVKESGGGKFLVGKGWHTAKVETCVEQTSSKGNPMWIVDYIVVDGPSDSKQIRDWVSLTDKALWRAKWMLSEMGFDMAKDADVSIEADDLRNRLVGIQVDHMPSEKTDESGKPYTNHKIVGFCKETAVAGNVQKQIADGKGAAVPADSEIPF